MRAFNKKKKPKGWTKPKWHRRRILINLFYVLKSSFMKEKVNIAGLELKTKVLLISSFSTVKMVKKNKKRRVNARYRNIKSNRPNG